MNRLTYKVNDAYYVKEARHLYEDCNELVAKLGQYEDLEVELGVDLPILFKALKQDYIYFKYYYGFDNRTKIRKEYILGLKYVDDDNVVFFTDDCCGKEHIVYVKDYKKTWALCEEDLKSE